MNLFEKGGLWAVRRHILLVVVLVHKTRTNWKMSQLTDNALLLVLVEHDDEQWLQIQTSHIHPTARKIAGNCGDISFQQEDISGGGRPFGSLIEKHSTLRFFVTFQELEMFPTWW
jgi:hypothetical protein